MFQQFDKTKGCQGKVRAPEPKKGIAYKKGNVIRKADEYKKCRAGHTSDNSAQSFANPGLWEDTDAGLDAGVHGYEGDLLETVPWFRADSVVEVYQRKDYNDAGAETGELKWYIIETVMRVGSASDESRNYSIVQLLDDEGNPTRVAAIFR